MALEAVEIDHQQRERLAAALGAGAFLGQALQQMAPVADPGEIVEQRQIGDLVAQPVDRHQQETEIPRHRQEHQHQDQRRLQGVEVDHRHFAADPGHRAEAAEGVDGQNENGDDAEQPRAGIFLAVAAKQHQRKRRRDRDRLAQRIDHDPHRHVVVDLEEEQQAEAGRKRQRDPHAPGAVLAVEPLDAHRGQAAGEHQQHAATDQRQHRVHHAAQHRQRGARRRGQRRRGPVFRGSERRIGARDIGPDQAHREKIDDEHRPQRRNIQHRNPRTRIAFSPAIPGPTARPDRSETIPVILRAQCASRRLTESLPDGDNGNLGFERMNDAVRFRRLFHIGASPWQMVMPR